MNIKKVVLGLAGALLMGGLGNGVWEYVLEPMLAWSLHGILNIATLGVQSFKDALYQEIAKGFHEESSLVLAITFNYLIAGAVIFALLQMKQRAKKILSEIEETNNELDELEKELVNPEEERSKSIESLKDRISKSRARNSELVPRARLIHKTTYALFVCGVAFYTWMLIGAVKDRYINSAIVHYEQSLAIVTPYASTYELSVLNSRFARIASKNDYVALMDDVAKVGRRGNLNLAQFNIW